MSSLRHKVDGDLRPPSSPLGGRVPSDDDSPGVPLFRTWRGVYWFVFTSFAAMVIALTLFTRFYG